MTIISSISLGVCWFDLSLLICQSVLISLTDREIKRGGRGAGSERGKGRRGWGAKGKWRILWPMVPAGGLFLSGPKRFRARQSLRSKLLFVFKAQQSEQAHLCTFQKTPLTVGWA